MIATHPNRVRNLPKHKRESREEKDSVKGRGQKGLRVAAKFR